MGCWVGPLFCIFTDECVGERILVLRYYNIVKAWSLPFLLTYLVLSSFNMAQCAASNTGSIVEQSRNTEAFSFAIVKVKDNRV